MNDGDCEEFAPCVRSASTRVKLANLTLPDNMYACFCSWCHETPTIEIQFLRSAHVNDEMVVTWIMWNALNEAAPSSSHSIFENMERKLKNEYLPCVYQ